MTHMQRVEGMLSSYKAGHFPAKLHLSTLQNYAYGMGFFYPQLPLIIPLILRIIGLNFILSSNASLFLLNVLTSISLYFCVYRITRSKIGAFCAAITGLFSYYRCADLFYRGSVGETAVFIFTPLLILGIIEIYEYKKTGVLFTVIGLSGILYSHLLSFVFTVFFLIVFLLLDCGTWIRDKAIRNKLLLSAGIAILLTASFWLPFLEQYFSVAIHANSGYESPHRPAVPLHVTFRIISYWFRKLPENFFDPVMLTYPVIFFSFFAKNKKYNKIIIYLTVFGTLGFILSSNIFPWSHFSSLHDLIQFPWRFMFLVTALLPMAAGIAIGKIEKKKICLIITGLLLGYSIYSYFPVYLNIISEYVVYSVGYKGIRDDIGAEDYLPVGAEKEEILENGKTLLVKETSIESYTENGLSAVLVYSNDKAETVEFPFLFYKGWYYQIDNGSVVPAVHGSHGLVQADLSPAEHGSVRVYYQKTLLQKISEITACAGGICLFLYIRKTHANDKGREA